MERLLNIWQERSLYRADFIQQLKLAIEDSDSPKHKSAGQHQRPHITSAATGIYFLIVYMFNWVPESLPVRMSIALNFHFSDDRKNLKRSYQKVQEEEEEEDDDYRGHYSPRETDAAAPQLVRTLLKVQPWGKVILRCNECSHDFTDRGSGESAAGSGERGVR